jgi:hypothetical protein
VELDDVVMPGTAVVPGVRVVVDVDVDHVPAAAVGVVVVVRRAPVV